jgi:hypothetical protein
MGPLKSAIQYRRILFRHLQSTWWWFTRPKHSVAEWYNKFIYFNYILLKLIPLLLCRRPQNLDIKTEIKNKRINYSDKEMPYSKLNGWLIAWKQLMYTGTTLVGLWLSVTKCDHSHYIFWSTVERPLRVACEVSSLVKYTELTDARTILECFLKM